MPEALELTAAQLYQAVQNEWGSRRQEIPWGANDPRWTEWIKSTFHHIGERELKGFGEKGVQWNIESTKLKNGMGQGEYLVDVCWWIKREGRYRLELAVESEWNPHKNEIEQDFYKLVDVKSRLKVWVCSYGPQLLGDRLSAIEQAIRSAQIKTDDEEYLILNLPETRTSKFISSFIVQPFIFDWQGKRITLRKAKHQRSDNVNSPSKRRLRKTALVRYPVQEERWLGLPEAWKIVDGH